MAMTVGQPLDRVDGRLKVTGAARYAAEIPLANLAHAVLVQSTIGKGRIIEIDTKAAERAPGVIAVLTHRNAPRPASNKASPNQPGEAFPLLQDDKVHYNGQHIGLVVAETFEQAPYASTLLRVRYEEERPVKLVLTRRQMYTSNGFRSKTIQRVRLGAGQDGRLSAVMFEGIVQTAPFGEFVEPCGLPVEMMYSCPNVAVTHRVAHVNAGIPTFMRAPGEATGMYALESAMDELAHTVGVDPIELR